MGEGSGVMVVVGDVTCSAEGHKDSLTSLAELEGPGPGPGAWGLLLSGMVVASHTL